VSAKRAAAGHPEPGDQQFSHKVRIWAIRTNAGARAKSYSVQWVVSTQEHHETFSTRPLAEAFRAQLVTYANRGTPFDVATGRPEAVCREAAKKLWYQHMCDYVDMKWPTVAPKSRTSIAEALATVTLGLDAEDSRGRPTDADIRGALYGWALVVPARRAGPAPEELRGTVRWLERNTVNVADLQDPTRSAAIVRRALQALTRKLDGTQAAPNTVARKRTVFYSTLEYAVELGLLTRNPIDYVAWSLPKSTETVDSRVVINQRQARALLAAVEAQPGAAKRLVAFFCLHVLLGSTTGGSS
jgi:hypothetical protein